MPWNEVYYPACVKGRAQAIDVDEAAPGAGL
jgi:hypothetical protein